MAGEMTGNRNQRGGVDAEASERELVRSLISLVLFLHLFCIVISLSANLFPSALQWKLLRLFAPYAQLLNFDLSRTPYERTAFQLIAPTVDDMDYRLEILPQGADPEDATAWVNLSDDARRGTPEYERYRRLARMMVPFVTFDDKDRAALVAQAVAAHFWRAEQVPVQQIRCRRHVALPREVLLSGTAAQQDENAAGYFEEVYRANVIIDGDDVDVIKIESDAQVARPTDSPTP
jgi:hypothetical protein